MTQRTLLFAFAFAGAAALTLAACDRAQQAAPPVTGAPIAALPLASAPPPPEQVAPYANQLPPAPPLPRARPRRAAYSYIDDAYWLGDTFADSPPDYTVDYDGEYPWIWRTSDGAYRICEDTPDGWREYYYYGDSAYPFLIRDAGYAYAYDGPDLVMVYDSYGRPYDNWSPQLVDFGTRDFFRAQRLYDAAIHQQRRAAYAADWRAHRDELLGIQQQWAGAQQRNPDWRAVHEQRIATEDARFSNWNRERAQRVAYAARTAPMIAAAPAPARAPREPRPGLAFAPQNREGPAVPPPAFRANPPPGMAVREQAIAEARARQAGRAAELQGAQQNRFAEQQGREQQRAQAQAQTRAIEDQRRQAELARREQRQGQMTQERQVREQAQGRAMADQRRQAELAAQAQARQAQAAQGRARDVAAREQAAQARAAEHARQGQAQRAAREQQAQAMRAQQGEAQRAAREQQAQAAQASRAAEQQQRQAQAQQAHAQQAQAAAQHAQQAAAQAQGQPRGQGGGHPHPDKKDKPQT